MDDFAAKQLDFLSSPKNDPYWSPFIQQTNERVEQEQRYAEVRMLNYKSRNASTHLEAGP